MVLGSLETFHASFPQDFSKSLSFLIHMEQKKSIPKGHLHLQYWRQLGDFNLDAKGFLTKSFCELVWSVICIRPAMVIVLSLKY